MAKTLRVLSPKGGPKKGQDQNAAGRELGAAGRDSVTAGQDQAQTEPDLAWLRLMYHIAFAFFYGKLRFSGAKRILAKAR